MLNIKLRVFLIVAVVIYLAVIINMLRKEKLDLKYTLIWLLTGLVLLIFGVFPELTYQVSALVGIETPVNMIFVIEAIFVLAILLSLTVIVSQLNKKNRRLTQSVALLEKRLKDLEEKTGPSEEES